MPEPRSSDRGSGCTLGVVREGGVEPPRPFGHTDLNRARLPIPPLAREARSGYPTLRRPPKPGRAPGTSARSRPRPARYDASTSDPPPVCACLLRPDAVMLTGDAPGFGMPETGVGTPDTSSERRRAWESCRSSRTVSSRWSPGCSPRPSAAPCSRSRSPPPCSARSTTPRRSSPATGGWCPTSSTSSSPARTTSASRRTPPRWRRSSPRCSATTRTSSPTSSPAR